MTSYEGPYIRLDNLRQSAAEQPVQTDVRLRGFLSAHQQAVRQMDYAHRDGAYVYALAQLDLEILTHDASTLGVFDENFYIAADHDGVDRAIVGVASEVSWARVFTHGEESDARFEVMGKGIMRMAWPRQASPNAPNSSHDTALIAGVYTGVREVLREQGVWEMPSLILPQNNSDRLFEGYRSLGLTQEIYDEIAVGATVTVPGVEFGSSGDWQMTSSVIAFRG